MLNLTKIIISPSNGQFKFIDDKYLIGKSESNNDELDNLLFVRRNIKEISVFYLTFASYGASDDNSKYTNINKIY